MHPFWETTLSRETVREQPCEFITPDNTPNVSEIMTRSLRNIYWRKKPFGNTNFWGVNRCTQLLVMGEGWSIAQSLYNWTQKKVFQGETQNSVQRINASSVRFEPPFETGMLGDEKFHQRTPHTRSLNTYCSKLSQQKTTCLTKPTRRKSRHQQQHCVLLVLLLLQLVPVLVY